MARSGRISFDALAAATDGMRTALLAGHDLSHPLQAFCAAAGADAAAIVRDRDGVAQDMVHTPGIDEQVRIYLARQAPPDPREKRVALTLRSGHLADYDSFAREELDRDPYYQEFLRPLGFFWHAAACLVDDGRGQTVLGLKRRLDRGHYERSDLQALDRALPLLRETAAVARAIALAEARGEARGRGQGGVVVHLDEAGRRLDHAPPPPPDDSQALAFTRDRVVAARRFEQAALDDAIGAACRRPFRHSTLALTAANGVDRVVVRVAPVGRSAASLFRGACAILTAIPVGRRPPPTAAFCAGFAALFALTPTEARVAALVGLGWTPFAAARRLGLGEGTARNHLKSAYAKIGVTRQAELALTLAAMRA